MKSKAKLIVQLIILYLTKIFSSKREFYSFQYLYGKGIEIGALSLPLLTPPHARVQYVDRMNVFDLRKQYPELQNYKLVEVDIIGDGEELVSVADSSLDFVITNHFFEHCQNPLLTLRTFFRVLKNEGILYLCIPDKEKTFDYKRKVTPIAHIVKDFEIGPEQSKKGHFMDWAENVTNLNSESEIIKRVNELMEKDYSIHFHVWDEFAIIEFFIKAKAYLEINYSIGLFTKNNEEFILIIKKGINPTSIMQ